MENCCWNIVCVTIKSLHTTFSLVVPDLSQDNGYIYTLIVQKNN